MTREEAIARLECSATGLTGTLSATTEQSAAEVLQRYIDAYDMAIAALREQEELESKLRALESSGWISVEERLPDENERVIAFRPQESKVSAYRFCVMWGYAVGVRVKSNISLCGITHWMPLPEPPEVEV